MKRTGLLRGAGPRTALVVAQSAQPQAAGFLGPGRKASESVDIDARQDMLQHGRRLHGRRQGRVRCRVRRAVKGLHGIYSRCSPSTSPASTRCATSSRWSRRCRRRAGRSCCRCATRKSASRCGCATTATDGGMFFVAAEPTELVLINIAGKVDLETLRKLQGRMGVPRCRGWSRRRPRHQHPRPAWRRWRRPRRHRRPPARTGRAAMARSVADALISTSTSAARSSRRVALSRARSRIGPMRTRCQSSASTAHAAPWPRCPACPASSAGARHRAVAIRTHLQHVGARLFHRRRRQVAAHVALPCSGTTTSNFGSMS